MADLEKINDCELQDIAGGKSHHNSSTRRVVAYLQRGYLAMRTAPTYDYSNEIRGAELYNGDTVYISGETVKGYDGKTYVWVYSPKSGVYGYVNKSYLAH